MITWIGKNVRVMRKAKVSVHAGEVKRLMSVFSIEVAAENQEDVDEEHIIIRLRKVRAKI